MAGWELIFDNNMKLVFEKYNELKKLKTLKLYGIFLWMGFNCLKTTETILYSEELRW